MPIVLFYGLVRHGGDTSVHERHRLLAVRGQMQVGVENLTFMKVVIFGRLRLFHLHDHVAAGENVRRL